MKALIAAALERTRTVLLLLVFFIVCGTYAYVTIPKESTPDIKVAIIGVTLTYNGISPQDSERLLVRPTEQELKSIEGIKKITSTVYEGGGYIVIEFHTGFDTDKVRSDVREKVNVAKSNFPDGTKEPEIDEINPSLEPILTVKLSGDVPERQLLRFSRDIKDEIEAKVSSVLKVSIIGDREDSIEILLDPLRQEQYNLVFDQIYQQFAGNNQIIPAGSIDGKVGSFGIKVPGLLENIKDIRDLPIVANDGAILRLRDVADIRRTFKDPTSLAHDRIELGKSVQTIALAITKRSGENLIHTVEAVKEIVENAKKDWPSGVVVNYAQDQSDNIREMLNDLQNNIILAIILVMAVIVFSLGWRSAVLVGIAVPGSFLMGIMVISLLGYTVNIVVLFSLIFSVGMLVDGAIIVVEYANRKIADGLSPKEAYKAAATRMAWPVITSTLTILVVFLPLLFWPGVVGQFMKFMPITLIAVLAASMLMALLFVPAIASLLKPQQNDHHEETSNAFTVWYFGMLQKALDHPKNVLMGAFAILIIIKTIHGFVGKGVEFFPDVEPDSASISIHARGNLSIYEKETIVSQVEKTILDMAEFKSINSSIGNNTDDTIGEITLEFANWKTRRPAHLILEDVEKRTSVVPGITVDVSKEKSGPSAGKPISIDISSNDRAVSEEFLLKMKKFMQSMTGLNTVEDSLPTGGIEWSLQIDRDLVAQFGCNISLIGSALQLITNGIKVSSYRPDDVKSEVGILLRFLPEYRSLEQLSLLRIPTKDGLIPMSLFVKSVPTLKVGSLSRINGYPVVSLSADVQPGVLVADKIKEIQQWIQKEKLPTGVFVNFSGENEDRNEATSFLMRAFCVAIFLVAAILVTQFNSFFSMGLVLSAVVLSTAGVFFGLIVHNLAFGVVMGGIGVIALAGIIVSNNIILIDTYDILLDDLKKRVGVPTLAQVREVIVQTCQQRLRPVILTKLTCILGLLPIMCGINIDFINFEITHGAPSTQWWVLLSTCIVYGVLFASSLTLFVTPSALMLRAKKLYPANERPLLSGFNCSTH
ncbi:MAG: efflux RND transporter permease subunit [Alphaproteobacteria bacterium]|nr:efflux RND transporter permease subunit [Alphaproteobacteria bacterium]